MVQIHSQSSTAGTGTGTGTTRTQSILLSVSLSVLTVLSVLNFANASPYIISDDRVRNLDVTPQLGRGYSIMTNSYQSVCLMVEETTIPSFNYDCKCNCVI